MKMFEIPFRGRYRVTAPFGIEGNWKCGWHIGVDLVGDEDRTVYAIGEGVVESINAHGSAYGNHVCVKHGNGMVSLYAHLKSIAVKKGQSVNAKTPLGIMGATGNVTGAHLHLEVHKGKYKYPAKGSNAKTSTWLVDPMELFVMVDNITIIKDGKKVVVQGVNIDGNNYIKLRDVERLADVAVGFDGEFATVNKKEFVPFRAYDYDYKQTSGGKVIAHHMMRVWEVPPKRLRAMVVKGNLNEVKERYVVNAGFFWWEDSARKKPYSLSILVSEGKVLCNAVPHGKACGCLLVYGDGSVAVKKIGNIEREKNVWFAVGGLTVCPVVDSSDEGFIGVYRDVLRETSRVVMGWNATKRKVIISGYQKMAAVRARDLLKELGCISGITLDAGGSALMKEGETYYLKSDGRNQFGCVYVE